MTALIFLIPFVIYLRGITRSVRILAEHILSQIEPEFEVELAEQSIEGEVLHARLTIMAVENPAVFCGGRFRLYSCNHKLILDLPLDSWTGRKMVLGQGFRVPIEASLPRDEHGAIRETYHTGWVAYSDARSLAHYRMTFNSRRSNEVRRIGRAHLSWLRLTMPHNQTGLQPGSSPRSVNPS